MWKAEACEANVLVVEISQLGVGDVLTVHANVHEYTCRTCKAPGSVKDVLWCTMYHANEVWQRDRRDQRIVMCHVAIREAELSRVRIERYQLMIKFQGSQWNELPQIGYESTLTWIAEVGDVVNVRG